VLDDAEKSLINEMCNVSLSLLIDVGVLSVYQFRKYNGMVIVTDRV